MKRALHYRDNYKMRNSCVYTYDGLRVVLHVEKIVSLNVSSQ